jgi:hypothetical protein
VVGEEIPNPTLPFSLVDEVFDFTLEPVSTGLTLEPVATGLTAALPSPDICASSSSIGGKF